MTSSSSSFVLSKQDLIDLTGYRQKSAVMKWLKSNGFQFFVGADGWPRVLKDMPKTLTRSAPNVAALKEMQNGKTKKASTRPA